MQSTPKLIALDWSIFIQVEKVAWSFDYYLWWLEDLQLQEITISTGFFMDNWNSLNNDSTYKDISETVKFNQYNLCEQWNSYILCHTFYK